MSGDILKNAEAVVTVLDRGTVVNVSPLIRRLVVEIKRLREIEKFLEIESEDSNCMVVSINGKTYCSIDVYNEKVDQLSAKDIRITQLCKTVKNLREYVAKYQEIAKEERARFIHYTDTNNGLDRWHEIIDETKKEYLDRAAKELSI